jgi:ubiquinone/menaquinone biosynthesis C-methylase UbiE
MNEFELLVDLHRKNPRQGPGSTAVTEQAIALTALEGKKDLRIADMGCGTGGQTLTLAKNLHGHITAVDLFPEFLAELSSRAKKEGLGHRIKTLAASMENLPFGHDKFDLIWSEGAIYLMGFEKGISAWRRYLKPGGIIAVSDICWLTATRPREVEEFWKKECPEIDTAEAKLKVLSRQGFTHLGHFILPQECWIENYYLHLQNRYEEFLKRQNHSQPAQDLVDQDRQEYKMYLKNKDYYSYGFYIAKKE